MAVHRQHSAQGPSSWRPGTDQLLSTTISPLSQPSEESPHKKLKLTTSTPTKSPETQEPPHSMTQTDITMTGTVPPTSNHPQEDASTRTHRINSDLVKLFNRPASNPTTSTSKSSRPASIKGIGLYTHIEGPKPTPRFPHERYTLTAGPPAFLPLKDAARGRGRTREPGAEDKIFPWDEKVQKVWEEMRHVILEEEKKQSKRGDASRDPRKIYAALGVPKVPLPSSQTQDKNQIPIQTEDAKFQTKGSLASVQSQQERRRSSTSVVATDTQSRRALLQSPADDTPRSATKTNMYDAARDPRRRGR